MWQQTGHSGVSILNEILGKIKLDQELVRENNRVLHAFLKSFVVEMAEVHSVFKNLYREPYYTGSFYSDLRISEPDEFDINLIIDLPFEKNEFTITAQPQEPNFVKYHSYIPKPYDPTCNRQKAIVFDGDGFLITESVREWFQSIIDKALESYELPRTIDKVFVREAGPARTITILKNNGGKIDVDLVPVISCTLDMSGRNLDRRVEAKVGSNLEAFLVPKPFHPLCDPSTAGRYVTNREKAEAKRMWRCHFPKPEEDIIYNVGCAKSVIKLLKLLRDKEQWSILASYYLKTVVMWMIIENSGKHDFWREDKLPERFLEALEKLAKYVKQMNIPYIFNTSCNLIEKMSQQEAYNIHNRLNGFIRNINSDISYLRRMF